MMSRWREYSLVVSLLLSGSCGVIPKSFCSDKVEIFDEGRIYKEIVARAGLGVSQTEQDFPGLYDMNVDGRDDGSGDWYGTELRWGVTGPGQVLEIVAAAKSVLDEDGGWEFVVLVDSEDELLASGSQRIIEADKGSEPTQRLRISYGTDPEEVFFFSAVMCRSQAE